MQRRNFLAVLGVVGAGAIAPTVTAVAAIMPDKRLKRFSPSHPDFAKPNTVINPKDFRDLAATVDALVDHVSR